MKLVELLKKPFSRTKEESIVSVHPDLWQDPRFRQMAITRARENERLARMMSMQLEVRPAFIIRRSEKGSKKDGCLPLAE